MGMAFCDFFFCQILFNFDLFAFPVSEDLFLVRLEFAINSVSLHNGFPSLQGLGNKFKFMFEE